MATCSAIIARALEMARIVAKGDEATATESESAMFVLRAIYQRLADTALATSETRYEISNYIAAENERIYCTATVTLPTTINEGAIRMPRDLASIQYRDTNTGTAWRTYLSDKGTWARIDNLTETSDAPFADRNQDGLAALLATELAEEYGKEITPMVMRKAARFQSQMQPLAVDPVEYF